MAFPRNSIRAFLQYAKTSLFKAVHEEHNINIVIGNESAGLDVYWLRHISSDTDIHQTLIH